MQRQNTNFFRLARTQEIIFQSSFPGKLLEDVLHQSEGINQESQTWDPGKNRSLGIQRILGITEGTLRTRWNRENGIVIGLHMPLKT